MSGDKPPEEKSKKDQQDVQKPDLDPAALEAFNSDSFGRVTRLSKIELVTLIATSTIPGVAHGACACGY